MTASLETLVGHLVDGVKSRYIHAGAYHLEGNSLYHFGKHYLMARVMTCGEVLVNTYKYSIRTAGSISKLSYILREMKYPDRLVLPFSSAPGVDDNRWWMRDGMPPWGQMLTMLLGQRGNEGLSERLETARRMYNAAVEDDLTIPWYLWEGDTKRLRDLLGWGTDSFLPVLHSVTLKKGIAEAEALIQDKNWTGVGEQRETAWRRLVHEYGGIVADPKAFRGYEARTWAKLMAVDEAARPALAAELLLSPRFAEHAAVFLNNYNNRAGHDEVLRIHSMAGV